MQHSLKQNMTTGLGMELATKKQTHIARKIWHVSGVGIALWLFYILPYDVSLGLISALSIILVSLDMIRLKSPVFKKVVVKMMGLFMRQEELNKPTGLSFMCIGFWLLILLFDRQIAIMTLLFVMLGDPVAAYIGIKYGEDKIGDKSVQGFLACFVVCLVISLIYLYVNDFNSARLLYVSLLAALFASTSELIQIPKIDDNLSMPVICGFLLTILFNLTA